MQNDIGKLELLPCLFDLQTHVLDLALLLLLLAPNLPKHLKTAAPSHQMMF